MPGTVKGIPKTSLQGPFKTSEQEIAAPLHILSGRVNKPNLLALMYAVSNAPQLATAASTFLSAKVSFLSDGELGPTSSARWLHNFCVRAERTRGDDLNGTSESADHIRAHESSTCTRIIQLKTRVNLHKKIQS